MIGEQIAVLRRARGLTQDQLAEAAGVSVDVIRRLEQGVRHSARLNTLSKIAAALGCEMSVIIVPRTIFAPEPDRGIPAIREALTRSTVDRLGGLADADADIDLARLTAAVDSAWQIWQRGAYNDRVDRWSVFGPRLVAQSHVVNSTELGDFEGAIERSASVAETGSRVPPPGRPAICSPSHRLRPSSDAMPQPSPR